MMGTMKRYACFGVGLAFAATLSAQAPSVVPGGVLNSASFAKNANGLGSAVAPGSLISIFGSFTGATMADADTVPLSTSLGGVTVTFNNIPTPLLHTIPAAGFISAQMPFGIPSSGTVNVAVTIGGLTSAPVAIPVVPAAPGIFTYPADGQSNAILVFIDTDGKVKIAAPPSAAVSQVYPNAPIPLRVRQPERRRCISLCHRARCDDAGSRGWRWRPGTPRCHPLCKFETDSTHRGNQRECHLRGSSAGIPRCVSSKSHYSDQRTDRR